MDLITPEINEHKLSIIPNKENQIESHYLNWLGQKGCRTLERVKSTRLFYAKHYLNVVSLCKTELKIFL